MNTAKELYDRWLAQPELDTAVAEELHGIAGMMPLSRTVFTVTWNSAPAACAVCWGRAPTA